MNRPATSWEEILSRIGRPDIHPLSVSLPVTDINADLCPDDVVHTVHHFFTHLRCGIYVHVRDGAVHTFLPFYNPEYTNTWGVNLTFEGHETAAAYHAAKPPPVQKYLPVHQWWANAGIVCNLLDYRNMWSVPNSDAYLSMLRAAAPGIKNAHFMLNVRDCPQLRRDGTHPQPFLFTAASPLLHTRALPVLSGYTGPEYADIPIPLPNDVAVIRFTPWASRHARAVFRGSATGCGNTVSTNQRIALVALSRSAPTVLDAKLTSWSHRDKVAGGRVHRTHPLPDMQASRTFFLSPQAQTRFKYTVYVDGHSASNRFACLLAMHSCILRVASPANLPGSELWFYHMLKPWVHYVPVAADLSDLLTQLHWLCAHDAIAERIARNGWVFWHTRLRRDGAVRAMSDALHHVQTLTSWC